MLEQIDLEDAEMDNLVMLDLGENAQLLSVTKHCTSKRSAGPHSRQDPTPTTQYQCWPTWLSGLSKLKNLDTLVLRSTGLHAWPQEVFLSLRKLSDLDVSGNHLTSDTLQMAFNRTGSFCIQALNLSSNNIVATDGLLSSFLPPECLLSIDLSDNLLDCSCSLAELIDHRDQIARFDRSHYTCYMPDGRMPIPIVDFLASSSARCRLPRDRSMDTVLVVVFFLGLLTGLISCAVWYRRRRRKLKYLNGRHLCDTNYTLLNSKTDDDSESPVNL